MPKLLIILAGLLLLTFANIKTIYAQTAKVLKDNPDSTLFTQYDLRDQGIVDWSVCGHLEQSMGCYSAGLIGPFAKVGSMIEGEPSVDGNVVTRAVYLVDSGTSNATLYVYKKVDTINQPMYENTTFTLSNNKKNMS